MLLEIKIHRCARLFLEAGGAGGGLGVGSNVKSGRIGSIKIAKAANVQLSHVHTSQVDPSQVAGARDGIALRAQLLCTQRLEPAFLAVNVPADNRHHRFLVRFQTNEALGYSLGLAFQLS